MFEEGKAGFMMGGKFCSLEGEGEFVCGVFFESVLEGWWGGGVGLRDFGLHVLFRFFLYCIVCWGHCGEA